MNRYMKIVPILMTILLLAACGKSISGTYENSMLTVKFEPGKAYVTNGLLGSTTEVGYKADGDKITLEGHGGSTLVLTSNEDGSLEGMPGGTLKKKSP